MALSVTAQTPDDVSATSVSSHMVATSVTSFSPSAGSLVRICAGWLDATDTLGKTFTCADSHGNSYSVPAGGAGGDADGGCYLLVFDFVYSSAPGATTVSITASDNATADCLIQPYIITGQAASWAGAHNSFSEVGTSTNTYEITLTPTVIGSMVFVLAAPNDANHPVPVPISGTSTDKDWDDSGVGSHAVVGRASAFTSSLGTATYGWTSTQASVFGYGVMALEVVPASGGGGGGGPATLTRVQHNSANPGSTATSLTATLGSGVTSGNLLVATIVVGTNVGTVTPPAGWVQAGPTETVTSFNQTQIFYLIVGTGGATSFVFSWTGSHSFGWTIEEWNSSTGWPASPVDVTSGTTNTGTTVGCGSPATTAQASELWVGVLSWANSGLTLSGITSGWTQGDTSTFSGNNTQTAFYQTRSGTGTPTLNATISGGGTSGNAGVVATFKTVTSAPTDIPQINPGPTWLDYFKPGLPRARQQTVADSVNVHLGTFVITLPTLITSISSVQVELGSLAITLPVPTIPFTAVQINPSDVTQINPGPTWLDIFKPGFPRPRPQTVANIGPEAGPLLIQLPTLTTSINAVKINKSDVTQINPGPTWLEYFKPGLPKPRPPQPLPSPPVEFGSLSILLDGNLQYTSFAELQHEGTLAIVLPTPAISFTAVQINPSDVPQINPGPTWLGVFKPGLPKPKSALLQIATGENGPLAIPLPTLTTNLFAFVPNRSDISQINPGPTWLDFFKQGLRKPRPLTLPNTSPFSESGSLVIILPPGIRVQLEAGSLNIVLPVPKLPLQLKYQYGHLNIVIKPAVFSLIGVAQETESGILSILMPLPKIPLRGINGREAGTLTPVVPVPIVFLLGKVVHNGSLLIYLGGASHLMTRYEMFGCESATEIAIVLPGLTLEITGDRTRDKHPAGEIAGWLRAKRTRSARRRQLHGARIASEANRHQGEEDP